MNIKTFVLTATMAGCALAACGWATNSLAGDEITKRECILLGMLGGELPPECRDPIVDPEPDIDDEVKARLVDLRLATAPFFSIDAAMAAGWDVEGTPCQETADGGMGYHYLNLDQLASAGEPSLLRPEALLYMPHEDGSLEFVGVEYVIPAPDWPHEEPPELPALGQQLHYIPSSDVWGLHVWVGRHNPAGIFEDWNPDVHCNFAF